MTQEDIIAISYDAIWTVIMISSPVMIVGLVVGVLVGLLQALTQIQEMTLTFVPKILAIFVCLMFFLPFMTKQLKEFNLRMVDKIILQTKQEN